MSRLGRKATTRRLIERLFHHGLTSPTLIGEALGISKVHARRVLIDAGLHTPRATLAHQLGGLPLDLRADIESHRVQSVARTRVTVLTNSSTENKKAA